MEFSVNICRPWYFLPLSLFRLQVVWWTYNWNGWIIENSTLLLTMEATIDSCRLHFFIIHLLQTLSRLVDQHLKRLMELISTYLSLNGSFHRHLQAMGFIILFQPSGRLVNRHLKWLMEEHPDSLHSPPFLLLNINYLFNYQYDFLD